MQSLIELCVANKFNSLEKPKQIKLLSEPFSIENGLLTPTMKMKRSDAKNMFAKEIEDLYAAGMLTVAAIQKVNSANDVQVIPSNNAQADNALAHQNTT